MSSADPVALASMAPKPTLASNGCFATLSMYDWPEVRDEVDEEWDALRAKLRKAGVAAPERLVRSNADLPPVAGGIRGRDGDEIAPDPATLPQDQFDFHVMWRHPDLLFGQTCWGPMELGLADHVQLLGQPDYSVFEGGRGASYSSAIVMRASTPGIRTAAFEGKANIPVALLVDRRFAFNGSDSMSGVIALERDLQRFGQSLDIFSERILSGGHRNSLQAVAAGEADVATIDCRSWALARRFEPAAEAVTVVGWTSPRPGLPYIASRHIPAETVEAMRRVLA